MSKITESRPNSPRTVSVSPSGHENDDQSQDSPEYFGEKIHCCSLVFSSEWEELLVAMNEGKTAFFSEMSDFIARGKYIKTNDFHLRPPM